ncbi:Hha/YmoA family nucleoid-associated regulatory protein [Serratia proteamaculans]|uniref:Hha/YmoA family nucleoid-associated regulatory protein n=1 Tax=Serratia proteamaculans TaxID=28151 RepID=UPI0039BE4872
MDKLDYLLQLRRCQTLDTLRIVSQRFSMRLQGRELESFLSASDHRRAELVIGKNFDKIPKEMWKLVR